jgi:hypothetical protein
MRSTVPNEPFRERFQHLKKTEGLTLAEIAIRMELKVTGKTETVTKRGHTSRVGRLLGLMKQDGEYRNTVDEENAVKLCKALHIDPFEVNL